MSALCLHPAPSGAPERKDERKEERTPRLAGIAPRLPEDLRQPPPYRRTEGGLRVEACQATPAEETLGGDFYDCFLLDDGRLALVVGDICGRGPVAAVRVLALQYALRLLLAAKGRPGEALARLNNQLCREQARAAEPCWPVALTVAVADPLSGTVQCALAGAEPLLALRHGGGWDTAGTGGLLLGVLPGEVYPVATLHLSAGDWLLMVTDGITEARQGRRCLGYDGLTFLAASGVADAPPDPEDSLHWLTQTVLEGARAYAGGTLQDDVCLLAAQFTPPPVCF